MIHFRWLNQPQVTMACSQLALDRVSLPHLQVMRLWADQVAEICVEDQGSTVIQWRRWMLDVDSSLAAMTYTVDVT